MDEKIRETIQAHISKLQSTDNNNEQKILFVSSESLWFDVADSVMEISPGEIDGMLEDDSFLNSFSGILAINSIFATVDYSATVIAFHKLLMVGATLITVDFVLDVPDNFNGKVDAEFEPEIKFLEDNYGYLSSSSNTKNQLQSKLEKYCFGGISSNISEADFDLARKLRISLCETTCVRLESSGSLMEPRVRDDLGFRRRAAGAIFRKVDGNVEILLLKRKSKGYSFPGGGVELNESFEEAVLRECFEESGAVCEVFQQFEIIKDEEKKTLTKPYILECIEEVDEYPEKNREKTWISLETLSEVYAEIDETDFFGNKMTSNLMLSQIWDTLSEL